MWVLLVAVAMVWIAPGDADAKRRRRKKKRANMPHNWVWPPSVEMKAGGKACRDELSERGVQFKKASAAKKVANPVVVPDMMIADLKISSIFRKPPFVMDCHLALAFARHASLFRAAGIAEVRFSTIHDYRRVRLGGKSRGALSRHALGLAIDIYQFVTDDGETIIVEDEYGKDVGARLIPLHIALVASRGFRAVLSPNNDPRSHDDHFHLEAKMEIDPPKNANKRSRRARRAKAKRVRAKKKKRRQRAERRKAERRKAKRRKAKRRKASAKKTAP